MMKYIEGIGGIGGIDRSPLRVLFIIFDCPMHVEFEPEKERER